jgi:hypothetical protein
MITKGEGKSKLKKNAEEEYRRQNEGRILDP